MAFQVYGLDEILPNDSIFGRNLYVGKCLLQGKEIKLEVGCNYYRNSKTCKEDVFKIFKNRQENHLWVVFESDLFIKKLFLAKISPDRWISSIPTQKFLGTLLNVVENIENITWDSEWWHCAANKWLV